MRKLQESDARKINVYRRRFLLETLPAGHKPSDPHLQIFDNYFDESNLRLRKTRDPRSGTWEYLFQKNSLTAANPEKLWFERILLTKGEFTLLKKTATGETRKNRYDFSREGLEYAVDSYLGDLWGLNLATFKSAEEARIGSFPPPGAGSVEITGDDFFDEKKISDLDFAAIQRYLIQKKEGTKGASRD